MTLSAPYQPLPADFPVPHPTPYPLRLTLLLALVLLCLLPRAVMAWKLGGICPDAVVYLQMGDSLQRGAVGEAMQKMNLNLYPVILTLLHRAGLEWELAGKLWGVAISSLTVLPLFGWVRRQFDDRVALAACFLYAVHCDFIRWSPEVLRDPTFWFLCTLSLYLLWRAVTEVRLTLFAAAGLAVALAAMTRFEGLFLVVPLVLWTAWMRACVRERQATGPLSLWERVRVRASSDPFPASSTPRPHPVPLPKVEGICARKRLLAGAALCMGVFPALLVLLSLIWLRGHAPWELVRSDPLGLVSRWAQAGLGMMTLNNPTATDPAPIGWTRMIVLFASAMIKGITPLFALAMIAGMAGWRRVWRRREHQALFYTSLIMCAAIWIHLYSAHATCQRYFLPVVLMMCPFAGLGLLACSARFAGFWSAVRANAPWPALAGLAPAAFAATLSLTLALAQDCRYRGERAELGRWAHEHLQPSPLLLGPPGVTHVVNYYAHGQCEVLPEEADCRRVAVISRRVRPNLILLPPARSESDAIWLKRILARGFVRLDDQEYPGLGQRVMVLARRSATSDTAATGIATQPQSQPPTMDRQHLTSARMPRPSQWIAVSPH